jgi:hypothetical protein
MAMKKAARKAGRPTHVERLRKAGVLSKNPRHLSARHVAKINKLSKKEVDGLLRFARKVGRMRIGRHPVGHAWFL